MSLKRNSYSLHFKLMHDIRSASIVRGWHKQIEKLFEVAKSCDAATRTIRRMPGAGNKAEHQELEQQLHSWVVSRNNKGLRVKDKYIQLKALNLHNEARASTSSAADISFKASSEWLDRFKTRYKLVSRRQTTTRHLPDDAAEIALQFITKAQNLIDEHNIHLNNVLNMDQVPRYFETEPKSTITTKGSPEVLLRKGGTSHKRFTATFTITGDGQILKPHLLFSKLKNKPSCPPGVMVDVNASEMWSDDILLRHAKEIICSRKEISFYKQPVLYIIDSYSAHVKLYDENRLRGHNIFVLLVPPNLTSLYQPLDVAVNRSFQEFYRSKYDDYIALALDDERFQTPAGNTKVPKYYEIAEWVLKWIASKTREEIAKAFELCGLVSRSVFVMKKLHAPLRELVSNEISVDEWNQRYQDLVSTMDDREELCIASPEWYFPRDAGSSLFCCFCHIVGASTDAYTSELTDYMRSLEDIDGLFDDKYIDGLQKGAIAAGELELYAASQMHGWNIHVMTLDDDCRVSSELTYSVEDAFQTITVARLGCYFALKVNGMHL